MQEFLFRGLQFGRSGAATITVLMMMKVTMKLFQEYVVVLGTV